mgnify:CR=1 FL=1
MLDRRQLYHHFNPRSHEGNDEDLFEALLELLSFQSTFPRGERLAQSQNWEAELEFQSTFPRGERLHLEGGIMGHFEFQSTFPRGERRKNKFVGRVSKRISIHVPTRGTTIFKRIIIKTVKISIHVPTRGTTTTPAWKCLQTRKFQSTFPRGERLSLRLHVEVRR